MTTTQCLTSGTKAPTEPAQDPMHSNSKSKLPTWPTLGNLTNPIHPILHGKAWENSVDLNLLEPVLQLTSRLITSPALLPFWWTLFFSATKPEKYILYHRNTVNTSVELTDVPTTLSLEEAARTAKKLTDIAESISFTILDVPTDRPWDFETAATRDCTRAMIRLAQSAMDELRRGATILRDGGEDTVYLSASFMIASGLVHELAHAVVYLVRGRDGHFFPNSAVGEVGFECEKRVFGGLVDVHYSTDEEAMQCDPEVRFYSWPSARRVCQYIRQDLEIDIRLAHSESALPDAGAPEWRDTASSADIDFSYIRGLFSEHFWANEVSVREFEALHAVPKRWVRGERHAEYAEVIERTYFKGMEALEEEAMKWGEYDDLEKMGQICEQWERYIIKNRRGKP